jgi:ferritin
MRAYFESENLPGFAKWFQIQAQEELGHGMRFFDYMAEANGRAVMLAIPAPRKDFASARAALQEGLAHEKKVTAAIHRLVDLARAEKDHATENFLQWFVKEQVEEEANFTLVLSMVERAGDGRGLLMLDHELGKRSAEE